MMGLVRLLRSENLKIYARPSTRIMIAALLGAAFFSMATDRLFSPVTLGFWETVAGQSWVLILVKIFAIIVAGGIVANEHTWGTIKLLLIHPVGRGQILLAKYLAVLVFIVALMSILLLSLLFLNGFALALGRAAAGASDKAVMFGSFGDVSFYYLLRSVDIIVYASIALMLSVISRSPAFSIGMSYFAMLLGPELTELLAGRQWARYLLFGQTNLTIFMRAGSGRPDLPGLGFSLVVIGIYLVIFYVISWAVFTKRDVLD